MFKIEIIGNLGADCAVRNGKDGKTYNAFQVAVSMPNNQTIWFGVLHNRRENLEPYLKKGVKIFIRGDLRFTAKTLDNGTSVFDLDIFAKELELVGGNPTNSQIQQDSTPII